MMPMYLFMLLSVFFASVESFYPGSQEYVAMRLQQEKNAQLETYCSRERSRIAWNIIEEYLMSFVDEEGYNIPKTCRLHPQNDMFREQESHKLHLQANEWQCGYCKKIFLSEKFLDQHFDNRHSHLLDISRTRCLADVCGALHCDAVDSSRLPKSKCNAAAVDRNRHLCESLASSCFPPKESSSARRLHDFFLRQFCDAHTCSKDKKPFARGSRKKHNVLYYVVCCLLVIMLPLFYVIVYFRQREFAKNVVHMKRISKTSKKPKPY